MVREEDLGGEMRYWHFRRRAVGLLNPKLTDSETDLLLPCLLVKIAPTHTPPQLEAEERDYRLRIPATAGNPALLLLCSLIKEASALERETHTHPYCPTHTERERERERERVMDYQGQQEVEDDVYGGDVPEEAYMEPDFDPSADAEAADDSKSKELETMKKRLQDIEDEAGALREMQAKVEKEMGASQEDSTSTTHQAEKEEVDSRSIYVGNVDYICTPEEVQQHFQSCGTVNRVTILTDKFGQPKGFAYVEFVEVETVQNALLLNDTELNGRQLKVSAKRTNVPGMKQYRGRHPNPYFGSRRPFMPGPYAYPPFTYGRVPRFRRPMRYRPYRRNCLNSKEVFLDYP